MTRHMRREAPPPHVHSATNSCERGRSDRTFTHCCMQAIGGEKREEGEKRGLKNRGRPAPVASVCVCKLTRAHLYTYPSQLYLYTRAFPTSRFCKQRKGPSPGSTRRSGKIDTEGSSLRHRSLLHPSRAGSSTPPPTLHTEREQRRLSPPLHSSLRIKAKVGFVRRELEKV